MPPSPHGLPLPLPTLLASLPKPVSSGSNPVLVRPSSWPSTSYYKITRSTLKFRSAKQVAEVSQRVNPDKIVGGGPAATTGTASSKGEGNAESAESAGEADAELRASGRVWGMLFWNGQYVPPRSTHPDAVPDPLISGRTKSKWVLVDPTTLSEAAREVVRLSTPQSVKPEGEGA